MNICVSPRGGGQSHHRPPPLKYTTDFVDRPRSADPACQQTCWIWRNVNSDGICSV